MKGVTGSVLKGWAITSFLAFSIFVSGHAGANEIISSNGPSRMTLRIGKEAGIPVAPFYLRTIPDMARYLRVPCERTLQSLGLEKGSATTGFYSIRRSNNRESFDEFGERAQTVSMVNARDEVNPAVAVEHIRRISLERDLTNQAPVQLFLGEVHYSNQHAERHFGETGRIHIASSLPWNEFYPAVSNGVVYGGRSASDFVNDINKYLMGLYGQKYLPGALLANGGPVLGIPVTSAFGYYQDRFGALPGSIFVRTGNDGMLTHRHSVTEALNALETLMKEAGATDFGRAYPRIRLIVDEQGDQGGGFTVNKPK